MYTCNDHGWTSFERPCPTCNPMTVTSASGTTTPIEQFPSGANVLVEALKYLIKDIKRKPNDTRYATAIKKAEDALAQYNAVEPGKETVKQLKDGFNDKTIGKTIRDLPDNYSWQDIFDIGTGIPTGTKNFLSVYFKVPSLIKSPTPIDTEPEEEYEWVSAKQLDRQEDKIEHLEKCLKMLRYLYMNEYCGEHGKEVSELIMTKPREIRK